MGEFSHFFKNKKNLANTLILGILILAIPLGINLLKSQQIYKSRAAGDPIVFTGANVKQRTDGTWTASKAQISLLLSSKLGLPGSPSNPPPPPPVSIPPPPAPPAPPYQVTLVLLSDGHNYIQQTCPMTGGVVNFGSCSYVPFDLKANPHFSANTYLSFSPYAIVNNGVTVQLGSILLQSDGHTYLITTCPVNNGVPNFAACTYSPPADLKANPHFSANTYLSFSAYTIEINGSTKELTSILLQSDGHTHQITSCPVSNGVPNFGSCTYTTSDLKTNPHFSADTYINFDPYSINDNGNTTQLLSNLWKTDGHTVLLTTCPVSNGIPIFGACVYSAPYDLNTNPHFSGKSIKGSGTYMILK